MLDYVLSKRTWDNSKLIRQFIGADTITYNYSQSDQDIFVLSILDGLRNGTYLELGAQTPYFINNTALLAEQFGWTGISIDKIAEYKPLWDSAGRKFIAGDALKLDFSTVLKDMPKVIDYLSLDCDPSAISYNILRRVPLDRYQFKVITFEHDAYTDDGLVKRASRKYLQDKGYVLLASISSSIGADYEDWYVHPDYVDSITLEKHKADLNYSQRYSSYLYAE